jgi:hypothetical protein
MLLVNVLWIRVIRLTIDNCIKPQGFLFRRPYSGYRSSELGLSLCLTSVIELKIYALPGAKLHTHH